MRRFAPMPALGLLAHLGAPTRRAFPRIDRFVVRRHRGTAMRLLNTIVGSQRWGIARARPRGVGALLQGRLGRRAPAPWTTRWRCCAAAAAGWPLAIITTGNPSHAYGKATLRGGRARLLRGLRPGSVLR